MSSKPEELVPIRAACAMFGINANTLRGWERRYGIIRPSRGEGGQRGFGPADLEVLRRMVELTRDGMTASSAVEVIRAEKKFRKPVNHSKTWVQRFASAVKKLDATELFQLCMDAEQNCTYTEAVENVIFPELNRLGELWHDNPGTIAQEHCASLSVRSFLTQRYLRAAWIMGEKGDSLPVITLACVPDELHDLPLLHLANLIGDTRCAKPAVLTAGLPIAETIAACEKLDSSVLLLSATMPVSSSQTRLWMDGIRGAGWESRCVLAGGAFRNSRIFSESAVRAAVGNYGQAVALLLEIAQQNIER